MLLTQEKTKAEGVLEAPQTALLSTAKNQDTSTKNHAMMKAFIKVGLLGLNRFQASRHYHDTVLNSTISVLQKKYSIYFSRKRETVPNFTGGKTNVKRYWLDETNMVLAISAIEGGEVLNA